MRFTSNIRVATSSVNTASSVERPRLSQKNVSCPLARGLPIAVGSRIILFRSWIVIPVANSLRDGCHGFSASRAGLENDVGLDYVYTPHRNMLFPARNSWFQP